MFSRRELNLEGGEGGGGSVLRNQFQGGGGGAGSVLRNQFEGGGGGGLN